MKKYKIQLFYDDDTDKIYFFDNYAEYYRKCMYLLRNDDVFKAYDNGYITKLSNY